MRRRRPARRCGRDRPRWWWDNSNCRVTPDSYRYLEVIGLGARQLFEADARQGAAAPRVFDAGPGEGGVEIVAAVEEHRAGFEGVAERFGARGIRRENRG